MSEALWQTNSTEDIKNQKNLPNFEYFWSNLNLYNGTDTQSKYTDIDCQSS